MSVGRRAVIIELSRTERETLQRWERTHLCFAGVGVAVSYRAGSRAGGSQQRHSPAVGVQR